MSLVYSETLKNQARQLRRRGLTYQEIQKTLNTPIPKNTFTWWFKEIHLSANSQTRIAKKIELAGRRFILKPNRSFQPSS